MCSELRDDQAHAIKKIAEDSGFTDYDLKVCPGSIKGDNYMGIISTVKIISKDREKELNLILKSAHTNEDVRKAYPIGLAYEREILVYENIFPEFSKFQRNKNIADSFHSYAKLYGTSKTEGKEFLIFENLKEIGYTLWNRKLSMEESHIEIVFREYAKFHAVSFAMKKLEPQKFEELTKDLSNIFDKAMDIEVMSKLVEAQKETQLDIVRHNERALNGLKAFQDVSLDFYMVTLKEDSPNKVITHGDCWNNNILFMYDDTEESTRRPKKVCLLDWQVCFKGHLVCDLSYFFYSAASKSTLSNFEKYLKLYHSTLSERISEYGLDPEKVYSFQQLMEDWKKFSKYGLQCAFIILRVMLGDSEEVPDLEKTAKSGQNYMEFLNFEISRVDTYNERISDLIEFMMNNNFL